MRRICCSPIIDRAAEFLHVAVWRVIRDVDTVLRINADHARATTFLIHDGVLPSNEGRGYVLRKIMRRAMRNGRLAGSNDPYLHKLTGFVADLMKPAIRSFRKAWNVSPGSWKMKSSATRPPSN